jgi:hypothetical protein
MPAHGSPGRVDTLPGERKDPDVASLIEYGPRNADVLDAPSDVTLFDPVW